MYPSLIRPDGKAARLISTAMHEITGHEPAHYFTTAAFDQGYLNHVGIECVNFGPGEYRYAHTDLDMASVDAHAPGRTDLCARGAELSGLTMFGAEAIGGEGSRPSCPRTSDSAGTW